MPYYEEHKEDSAVERWHNNRVSSKVNALRNIAARQIAHSEGMKREDVDSVLQAIKMLSVVEETLQRLC